MQMRHLIRPARLGLVLACLMAPLSIQADQAQPEDLVLSLDARFHQGQFVRADLVPAGIRTMTYAQYLEQQRLASLAPRRIKMVQGNRPGWSIGVFR
jgi:hypothetical protein